MEYTIDFESFDSKVLQKVFCKEITKNINMLDNNCNYESFLESCVNNTVHILNIQEKLGKSIRAKEDFGYCIFCSEQIKKNEFKRILPCNHEFHKKCIDKWLLKYYSNQCPCCKQNIYQ